MESRKISRKERLKLKLKPEQQTIKAESSFFPQETQEKREHLFNKHFHPAIFVFLAILFVIVATAYLAIIAKIIEDPFIKLTGQTINMATPYPTPLKEIIPSSDSGKLNLTKEQIKILVLNGTGIAGQAGMVKDDLKKIGFLEVNTGNTEETEEGDTLIEARGISADLIEQIKLRLTKLFAKVIKEDLKDQSSKYDIVITTGKPL